MKRIVIVLMLAMLLTLTLGTSVVPAFADDYKIYSVTVSPSSVQVRPGETALYTGTVNSLLGMAMCTDLNLTGAPSGSTVSFFPPGTPSPGLGSYDYSLYISVPIGTTPGTYHLSVQATWWVETCELGQDTTSAQLEVLPANQPPVISNASPSITSLWPSNKKAVDVTIVVDATDSNGPEDIVRTTYSVVDEYEEYNVAETDFPENGIISLIAARDGTDTDGRIYTITITVYDTGDLSDSISVDVIVSHDQGKNGK